MFQYQLAYLLTYTDSFVYSNKYFKNSNSVPDLYWVPISWRIIWHRCSFEVLRKIWLVVKLCSTLFDSVDCSRPGSSASLYSRVCSNSYPLSPWCYVPISSFATYLSFCFSLFQHLGLFQWVGSLHPVAKVLELQF